MPDTLWPTWLVLGPGGGELRRAKTREERIEYPAHGNCGSNWRLFVS